MKKFLLKNQKILSVAMVFFFLLLTIVLLFGAYFNNRDESVYSDNIRRAVVFAVYSKNGKMHPDIYPYLKELKKYSTYIIVVGDNDYMDSNELKKLSEYADEYYFKRHGEYDFGSYKIGYLKLKQKGILEKSDKLLFCNDSVIYQNKSLKNFFKKEAKYDFYGLTFHSRGMLPGSYNWANLPHIQSYFLSISSNIFKKIWFEDFIKSVKKENTKEDVVAKYEIGLSSLILNNGFELNSYYPKIYKIGRRNFEPCGYFLSETRLFPKNKKLFIKRKPMSMFNP